MIKYKSILTFLGLMEATFGGVVGLLGIAYAAALFWPAEGKTMQDLTGLLCALAGIAGMFLFFAGLGLVLRKQYGRWLNIVLSLAVIAFILRTLWPIEARDTGDLSLVIPLAALIVFMFLPCTRRQFPSKAYERQPDSRSC